MNTEPLTNGLDAMTPLLVFDLGNVILDVDFNHFACRMADQSQRGSKEVLETFCRGPLKASLDRGQIGPMGFADEVSAWLGEGAPRHEEILAAWTDIFSLKSGAQGFLARYRLKYTIWLMSDTDPAHFISALNRFPLLRSFDRYIVSYAQGRLKRDPGAFRELSEVVARGRRVVLVDDLEVNISAAREVGIDGVLFTSWEELGPALKSNGVW